MVTGARSRCLETGRGRGREGRSHARQGRSRGIKTDSSTAGGGPVFCPAPSPARSFQGGPKPVAKPPGAVPSGNRNPASPTRTTGKGSRQKYLTFASLPRPSVAGISSLQPTAPVEPPVTAVVPSSRWPRRGRHHRRCRPGLLRALPAHHRRHAG